MLGLLNTTCRRHTVPSKSSWCTRRQWYPPPIYTHSLLTCLAFLGIWQGVGLALQAFDDAAAFQHSRLGLDWGLFAAQVQRLVLVVAGALGPCYSGGWCMARCCTEGGAQGGSVALGLLSSAPT